MLAPVIVTRLELSQDSGIPGKWRGGCGLITEVEPIDHEMTVIAWGEGACQPPPSVDGARYHEDFYKSKLARGYHLRDDEILKEVDSNQILKILPGERYRSQTSGGGGAGDPFTRDPQAVQDDVLNKKVSLQAARSEYGVVLDARHLTVDIKATDALRKSAQ
jgi:N-methylhydantoinase B